MNRNYLDDELQYPYNLLLEVFVGDISPDRIPVDVEEGLSYVLRELLSEEESFILKLRFKERMPYTAIGAQCGVAPQQIKVICEKALRKLRHPNRSQYLIHGYAEAKRKQKEKAIRERVVPIAEELYHLRLQLMQEEKNIAGPLYEIQDAEDRVNAILFRVGVEPIEQLRLPFGLISRLYRNGCRYVWQLCFTSADDLLSLRGIGVRSISILNSCLENMGLALDDGLLAKDDWLWDYAMVQAEAIQSFKERIKEECVCDLLRLVSSQVQSDNSICGE